MTRAELIKALEPFPDDIIVMRMGPPYPMRIIKRYQTFVVHFPHHPQATHELALQLAGGEVLEHVLAEHGERVYVGGHFRVGTKRLEMKEELSNA